MDKRSLPEGSKIMYVLKDTFPISWLFTTLIVGIFAALLSFVPWVALIVIATASLAVPVVFILGKFTLWQILAFLALTGYIVLNYGFANWTLGKGIPLPIGHLLAFMALFLALLERPRGVAFFREPIALCWLFLSGISFIHLLIDIPKFGAYAIRDASFIAEGVFLLLGFLWGRKVEDAKSFLRLLSVLFLLNFAYSLTFPIGELIRSHSPVSGIFRQVPIFGSYSHAPFYLLSGALFFLLIAKNVSKLPSIILSAFAFLQIGWSLIFQARSMYVGIIVVALVLVLFRNVGKVIKLACGVVVGIFILFVAINSFDIDIPGRIGSVEPGFYIQHFKSIFLVPDTPALGSARWRLELLPQAMERWTANTTTILVGEGFGEPLIDFHLAGGVEVRQPHNSHITILMRLGIIGLAIWVFIHWRIVSLFVHNLRRLRKRSFEHSVTLWFFLFYILGILFTTIQPWLEFSYGAIPFFIIIGFALGFLCERTNHSQRVPTRR